MSFPQEYIKKYSTFFHKKIYVKEKKRQDFFLVLQPNNSLYIYIYI